MSVRYVICHKIEIKECVLCSVVTNLPKDPWIGCTNVFYKCRNDCRVTQPPVPPLFLKQFARLDLKLHWKWKILAGGLRKIANRICSCVA